MSPTQVASVSLSSFVLRSWEISYSTAQKEIVSLEKATVELAHDSLSKVSCAALSALRSGSRDDMDDCVWDRVHFANLSQHRFRSCCCFSDPRLRSGNLSMASRYSDLFATRHAAGKTRLSSRASEARPPQFTWRSTPDWTALRTVLRSACSQVLIRSYLLRSASVRSPQQYHEDPASPHFFTLARSMNTD
jgi:hypothetical protein